MSKKKNISLVVLFAIIAFWGILPAESQNRFNASQSIFEFKFTTWNTEWLGCADNDPANDELQINNVVTVIKAMNSDLVALQEVNTTNIYATVDTIVHKLGEGWNGSIVLSTNYSGCDQYQAIVYKTSKVRLVSASLITDGGSSSDWSGGRFPVLYNVNLLGGGTAIPVSFVNIHAKAMGDATSYSRRKNASESLKSLLDGSTYNTKRVILLGDFNDYLTGTQCFSCSPADSPYKNFVDDTGNYKSLTTGLYDPAYSSPVIDNIIISNELFDNYVLNSTKRETTATQSVTNYTSTTSDHVPVSASFNISSGNSEPLCENISYSESFLSSISDFIPYSVTGNQTWYWRQTYGACVSGYLAGVNYPNENWLISPAFDLSNKSSASLTFNHALNYCSNVSDILSNQTLWVSANYTEGAPASASWTQLTIPNMPSGNTWTYVSSGNINFPSQMLQRNVRFAFKYLSTASVAGTWEIKDLVFNASCVTTDIATTATNSLSRIYVSNRQIKIINQESNPVLVYDITGQILFNVPLAQNIEIPVKQQGVYIVRIGDKANKVVVR